MAETVIGANEVSLNAVRYRLAAGALVQRTLSSIYPEKIVTGDYTKDSHPNLSTLALSDHRGGIGLDIYDGDGPANRSWYSTCDIRFKGHLILPPLVTVTTGLPTGDEVYAYKMAAFKGEVFVQFSTVNGAVIATTLRKYNDSTKTWGASLHTTSDNACTDAVSGSVGGSECVVFCNGTNYYYSTNGTSFTTDTQNASYLVIWDEKLWGVDTSVIPAQLWYVMTLGGPVINVATIPIAYAGEMRGLFVGPVASGDEAIYAMTARGLLVLDTDNGRFLSTALAPLPSAATATRGSFGGGGRWRDDIYFSSESSLLRYSVTSSPAIVASVGPDIDGGLPTGKGSSLYFMQTAFTDIFFTTPTPGVEIPLVLGWDGKGWRVVYEGAAGAACYYPLVAGAYGNYRLWFDMMPYAAPSQISINYITLLQGLMTPLQISTYAYAAVGTHDWPWFTAGQSEVTKVAVRVKVETTGCSATETVILSYATDYGTSYTAFATITANGVTTFQFPNSTTPTGTAFKAIRFRVALARGSTNTNTPDVRSVTLEYYKKLDPKYQFQVALDLSQEYGGNTPKQLRAALLTAQESGPLVEFTYRDPVSNTDATFYVQVQPQVSSEESGLDERGQSSLLLKEV